MVELLIFLVLITAAPPEVLTRFDFQRREVTLDYSSSSERGVEQLSEALQKGIELEVRFSSMLCKKRRFWLDHCSTEGLERKRIKYDPIAQVYKVSIDLLNDGEEPQIKTVEDLEAALKEASVLDSFPLRLLGSDREIGRYLNSTRSYLSVKRRIDFGNSRRSIKFLSRIITLGLLSSSEIDSGWEDFKLPSQ